MRFIPSTIDSNAKLDRSHSTLFPILAMTQVAGCGVIASNDETVPGNFKPHVSDFACQGVLSLRYIEWVELPIERFVLVSSWEP
jgi:hypothetical protein